MRILIVEDEEHLARGLKFNFEAEGYQVDAAGSGPVALDLLATADPPIDIVILDLMLPGMSGYEICEAIRKDSLDLPILVLSARILSEDKSRAFDLGVDQYVTKPFNLPEMLSRVRNLAKKRQRGNGIQGGDIVEFGQARVDFRRYEVTVDGESKKLTPMEMKLLQLFVRNEGLVLTRKEILSKVWDMPSPPETRTVDNFVMRLRKHFEFDPGRPRHFLSVRGAGYRFSRQPADPSDEEE